MQLRAVEVTTLTLMHALNKMLKFMPLNYDKKRLNSLCL